MSKVVRVPLDSSTGKTLTSALFVNVTNTKDFRAKLLDGSLKCCAVSAKLIIDPFQLVVAANKAAISAAANKLVTKTVYTELLFNLSTSKNISQALSKFGISDSDTNFIVCTIDDNEDAELKDVLDIVEGEMCDMEALSNLSDTAAIKKTYKIQDSESQCFPLVDSIVSRLAASDFISQ